MKRILVGMMVVASVAFAAACSTAAAAGPNGGDVVRIRGNVVAEVIFNAETGEVIVQTFDRDLKQREPIDAQPLTVGSDQDTLTLMPHPISSDPPGTCSRFYGQADWVRGGRVRSGWVESQAVSRQQFGWHHGWEAGRMDIRTWENMGEHRHTLPGHRESPMDR